MTRDYARMTLAQLDEVLRELASQRAALKTEARKAVAARDRLIWEQEIEDMPEGKRDVLRQVLTPASILSEEAIGEPSA